MLCSTSEHHSAAEHLQEADIGRCRVVSIWVACRLRSVLPQAADSTSPTAQALTDVDKLIEMLSVWEVGQSEWCSVSINPFLLIPSREYRRAIFQINVWMDKAGEAEVAAECVCTGGCYSSFLKETWPWQLCNEQIPSCLLYTSDAADE